MKLRHELKHEISFSDMLVLKSRLSVVMQNDKYAENGKYEIKSLYFDNIENTALREKLDGINIREKFRIRCYNDDFSFIRLEKKSKINGLSSKVQENITSDEVEKIVNGDYHMPYDADRPLLHELCGKMDTLGLRAKTIVSYTREPFICKPGNVRVTFDYNIRTSILSTDFLNPNTCNAPVKDSPIILEVKWDEYLPEIIKDIIQIGSCRAGAFSKYAACRIYG